MWIINRSYPEPTPEYSLNGRGAAVPLVAGVDLRAEDQAVVVAVEAAGDVVGENVEAELVPNGGLRKKE